METEKSDDKQPARRDFVKMLIGISSTVALMPTFALPEYYMKEIYSQFHSDVDYSALKRLFGIGASNSAALVPAADHPFEPPPENSTGYPIEHDCCLIYANMIGKASDVAPRIVRGEPNITSDDSIVLFGSQVSNRLTRDVLGDPYSEAPRLDLTYKNRWATTLWWNLYSPTGAEEYRVHEYGKSWKTRNHVIGGRSGESFRVRTQPVIEDDFLLVTCLPRYGSDPRRICIFSGIHASGQMATKLLLASPPDWLLAKIEEKIERQPYYQVLLHVSVKRNQQGELYPDAIKDLVDARALEVAFS